MENKNTLIAISLMLAVWLGFTLFFAPEPPPPPAVQNDRVTEVESIAPTPRPAPPAPEAFSPPLEAEEGVALREVLVENDVFRTTITNSGARIVSLYLKDYSETADAPEPYAMLDSGPQEQWNLSTYGTEGLHLPADLVYNLETTEDVVRLTGEENRRLIFTARLPNGLVSEKIYTFRGNAYQIDLQLRLRNTGGETQRGALALDLVKPWFPDMEGGYFEFVGPATHTGDKVQQEDVGDIERRPAVYGPETVWTGFVDKYFLSALIPSPEAVARVHVQKSRDLVINTVSTPFLSLAPGETSEFGWIAFYGPKEIDILTAVHPELSEALDFGFFSFLARPLLHVLKFFYSFLGNYGLAIILLTVIIKLFFWPLTHKSYSSMKAMQKLQPQMQKLRDKHKNDREKLNREIMELYKTHRVNPLGGCLPMLVQIPVFFALYKTLMISIELRHAPFIFWIQDLSAKDPYYITPIVMGATMFLQMKMSPTSLDPMQAKIFMFMPIIFTFMFLNFPSGLVLYWMINNILTILQQYMINRKVD
jgi:YidC/Oxa1 family membrane protein insertase